jgi:hypothetical protein
MKKSPKKSPKRRNTILAAILMNDPTRFKTRTVAPLKGKGRKSRPRNSNRSARTTGD